MKSLIATGFKVENGTLSIIDQQKLPREESWLECHDKETLISAIKALKVRGAPAIGIAAALFVGLEVEKECSKDEILNLTKELRGSRPTAVNLMNYMDRIDAIIESGDNEWESRVTHEAEEIFNEDIKLCEAIAENGLSLIPENANILTHCNTGSVATAGRGTALGIITKAHEEGRKIHVWVDETRPLLQGGRLTSWELGKADVPYTLIADNMAGMLMSNGKVDCVIVGADRIATNGDFANKIGTYSLAVLAKYHNVPFYIAAPTTTIDKNCPNGKEIPIEERDPNEVRGFSGELGELFWSPENSEVYNPAFDVTPAELVTEWILDDGVRKPPF